MSASRKKQLRSAENAAKMTEKQLTEQKEAKKLKIMTTVFVAAMVVFAAWTAISKTVTHSGIAERKSIAMTVGEHQINSAEMNYFFIDAVNKLYSEYGDYITLILDPTVPLNEQVVDEESGETWADELLVSAQENVKAVYALSDEAAAQGYALSETELQSVESQLAYLGIYASYYGYSNTEDYLKAMYGNGATEESYREYFERTMLADSYQSYYANNLTYEDADLRAAEAENYNEYSAYSYNSYYISPSRFLEGGTTDEEGNTTYSDEETAASVAAAEAVAQSLVNDSITSVAALDAAIAALEVNAETEGAASYAYENLGYSSVNSVIREWVADEARVEGDLTYIASTSTTTDEDGNEVTTTNGFYVVYFVGSSDNNYPLANVRHILVSFEGGTTDETTGTTTYSDDEKAAAKTAAEELLASWEAGDATEDSFAALADENSDDTGSVGNGGLYEDIYPGEMVEAFENWCFAEGRKSGDTGIVETEYGYHVMYYSGDSETLYRDFLITNALVSEDSAAWYNALLETMTVSEVNTKYLSLDLVMNAA